MTQLIQTKSRPCRSVFARERRPLRRRILILLTLTGLLFSLASCTKEPAKKQPVVPVTDTKPVGDGLKVIGYAMVGVSVVVVAGRLIH